jgi:TonB family protein
MRAAVLVGLFSLAVPVTKVGSVVKDPRVTVDMATLGRPKNAPLPAYPKEARLHSWGGLAIYEIHCKFDGTVGYVFVRLSTGHPILDEAGKAALTQWRWHGGRFRLFAVPMTFDPGTPAARRSQARAPEQPKEFESAKEKGLTYAPRPTYPRKAREQRMAGTGIFELRFNPDGTVSSVIALHSTGHDLLDESCKKTLAKWRCRPGLYTKMHVPLIFSADGTER